jgi:hypothetical protein
MRWFVGLRRIGLEAGKIADNVISNLSSREVAWV